MERRTKLIEHLLVLGVNTEKEKITMKAIQDNNVNPSLLEIYPPQEEGSQFPRYLENCNLWGFENGFKLYDRSLNVIYGRDDKYLPTKPQPDKNPKKNIASKNRMYSFVMTDEHYCKRYCTSLLFHEPYFLHEDEEDTTIESSLPGANGSKKSTKRGHNTIDESTLIYVPKSISVISSRPCFDTQRMILKYIYGDLLGKDKDYCDKKIKIPTRYIWNLACLVKDLETKNKKVNIDKQWEKTFEYKRDQHFLGVGKEEEVFIHESQLKEFYFSAVFYLLDVPSSPMDKVVLKMHNEDRLQEMIRYRIPKRSGIYLPETNCKMLLRRLSAKNIIKVFKYIILEKQIIFFSTHPEEIPYVTEALLSLISPLSWCCLYVPFLPIQMWEILHAVMPFIVGVSSRYKEFVANQIDLTDKIVVDLDDDALFIGEDSCEFPKEAQNYLLKELDQICALSRKADPKSSQSLYVDLTLKTRHLFNVAMLSIINNYLAFFKPATKQASGSHKNSASEVFALEKYLAMFPSNESFFLKELSSTMVFINLVEESYRLIYSDRNKDPPLDLNNVDEIVTFIEQIKAITAFIETENLKNYVNPNFIKVFHPRALEYMAEINADSIQQAKQRFLNPEVIDLFPYIVKYYFRFFLSNKDHIKLLSSPLSFKSSNQVSARPKSPDSLNLNKETELTSDFVNKNIQFFAPLRRNRIVDLTNIFDYLQAKKPNTTTQTVQVNRHSDPASKPSKESQSFREQEDRKLNMTAPVKVKNPIFAENGKKGTKENADGDIAVQIDYSQLVSMNDNSISLMRPQILQPNRHSMPMDYSKRSGDSVLSNIPSMILTDVQSQESKTQRTSMPGKHHNHRYFPHPTESIPLEGPREEQKNAQNMLQVQPRKSIEKSGSARWDMKLKKEEELEPEFRKPKSFAKNDDELKLYNSLHIPRKGSDTNYRIFGKAHLDESRKITQQSLQNLDQALQNAKIFEREKPFQGKNAIIIKKNEPSFQVESSERFWDDKADWVSLQQRGSAKKKIFEEKEVFSPLAEEKTKVIPHRKMEKVGRDQEEFAGMFDTKEKNIWKKR